MSLGANLHSILYQVFYSYRNIQNTNTVNPLKKNMYAELVVDNKKSMSQKYNNKRIAKNTMFLYMRMFLLLFVGFYTTKIILETLGINDFGLYNVIAGFVAMISFVNTSISNSIQRFLNFEIGKGENGNVNRYFTVALMTQLIIAGAFVVLAETIGLWFINNKLCIPDNRYFAANFVYQASIITIVLKIFQSPFQAMVIAKEKMEFYAYQSLIEVFLQLGIAFLLGWISNHKLEIYSVLLLFITICIFICNVIYSKSIQNNLSIKPTYDSIVFKEVFSFCGWNLFGSASGVLTNQGINVLMNVFFGVTINAARGIASQVYSGVQKFIANFQLAMNPQIVQSYACGDKERYLKLCYTNFKVSVYLMWIIVLPLVVCCQDVLDLWLGDNYPKQTLIFVDLVLLTGIVEALGSSISVPLYATGNIKEYQIVVSIVRMLSLPIAYVAYKMGYPAESSMLIILIVDILAQILRVYIWTKMVKINPIDYVKIIVLPLIITMLITSFFSYLMSSYFILESKLLKITSVTIFTLIINTPTILLIALSVNERKIVIQAVVKIISKNKVK